MVHSPGHEASPPISALYRTTHLGTRPVRQSRRYTGPLSWARGQSANLDAWLHHSTGHEAAAYYYRPLAYVSIYGKFRVCFHGNLTVKSPWNYREIDRLEILMSSPPAGADPLSRIRDPQSLIQSHRSLIHCYWSTIITDPQSLIPDPQSVTDP